MSLIGLDIGTTGCKAIVFASDGRILGKASREYPILTTKSDWAEQDAELVWNGAGDALHEAVSEAAQYNNPPTAMALSVQGEAVMPVDADGRTLRPVILGMDTRTTGENRWLANRFGRQTLFRRTGMPVHTINTLPKLLWLQKHEKDVWRKAHQFLLYEDFFLRRLCGRAAISHCLASRTQMYDLAKGDWADDILAECGIERNRLAALPDAEGGVVGTLKKDLAQSLGISGEVLVVSGGHDQACAALGSGVTKPGLAMVSTGTAEVVEVAMSKPVLAKGIEKGNISVYRHVVPGLYLAMTLNHSGGLLLRWFRDTLCQWERHHARLEGKDAYDLILAGATDGPTGLMVLPHFSGSGTPILDTASKGAVVGLTFASTKAEIAKAMLEGLTFELRINTDLLKRSGIRIKELHAAGGGAKSELWLQLKADICRIPLRIPKVTEAACLGAALLAGVGAGVYHDFGEAVSGTVQLERRVAPRPKCATAYDRRFRIYRQLYPALKGLYRQM